MFPARFLVFACALTLAAAGGPRRPTGVETLRSVAALPAHIAGAFDISACQQSTTGEYFIFDRRAHAVYGVPPSFTATHMLVGVGPEAGRILQPTAFDSAPDGTFVIVDAPGGRERVQVFYQTGASLGGFSLAPRPTGSSVFMAGEVILSGVTGLAYTGRSILISQPETGALVTEYALDGRTIRMFGELRATGQERDPAVHLALNTGRVVINPAGGHYVVFLAGLPMFRKYDSAGKLVFERHVEGPELDELLRTLPNTWPRKRGPLGDELPLITPTVRAAAADTEGNLWISLSVGYSYVYDASGEKRRTVQFRGAGALSPTALFFTKDGRLLVSPGCYVFSTRPSASPERA
jgi:hypothetical protein